MAAVVTVAAVGRSQRPVRGRAGRVGLRAGDRAAPAASWTRRRNATRRSSSRSPWAAGSGRRGRRSGCRVALAESTLFNYANDGTSTLVGSAEGRQLNDAERAVARESLQYPHDRVGNNLDSIGLFQQRPMTGWGTPAELIDPATAAGKFFDRLVQVPGWQGMPPWNAAQTVQGSPSSDGGIYRDMYEQATGIVTDLTTTGGTAAAAVRSRTPIRGAGRRRSRRSRSPMVVGRRRGVGTRTGGSRRRRCARCRPHPRCCWSAARRRRSTS